jgi:hypothetical protein
VIILRILAAAAVAVALVLRVWHRGSLYPGWDVLGAAEGLRLVATKTPAEIFTFFELHHFDGARSWNVYGVPLTLVPGALTWLYPWQHWASLTTLVFSTAAFALAAWAVLPPGQRWLMLLGVGSSGALLSWAVCGFAYGSAFWPYAAALAVVYRGRRLLPSLVGAMLALELGWHVQDLGPTVFVVFLLAVVGRRGVPLRLRALWLVAGAIGAYYAFLYPPAVVVAWGYLPSLAHLAETAEGILQLWLGPMRPDTPVLIPLALVSLLLVRRDRLLWVGLLGFQVASVVWLALQQNPSAIWPRRVLLLDSIAALVVLVAASDRPRLRPLIVLVLAAANVWQLTETIAWVRAPRDPEHNGWVFPLPYTHTTLDYQVPLASAVWADEIMRDVDAGKQVILFYNLEAYQENATNPTAIPERLYVRLGHERYVDNVLIFGSATERQHTVVMYPLTQIFSVLKTIRDPTNVVVHFVIHPGDPPPAKAEWARIRAAVEDRFQLVPAPGNQPAAGGETWQRGILAPKER